VLAVVMSLLPLLLPLVGVKPRVASEAARFVWARVPNVFPFLLVVALRAYLQANGVTRPIVIATIGGNLVNLAGNAHFIYGVPSLGIPAMGVVGSALSSSFASACMFGVLVVALRALPAPEDPDRRTFDPVLTRSIVRLGLPIAGQLVAEVGAFALAGVLCGRLGEVPGAAHQVALTLASITFTLTLGVSAATSVRVGQHVGHDDTPAARRAGFLGLATGVCVMMTSGLAFLTMPGLLARGIAPAAEIVAAAIPLVGVAAVFQVFDGLQVVAAGALRGAGDTRAALWANVIGYYVLGLPIGVLLGFFAGWGAAGVWWGLTVGLIVVAVWLVARFALVSSRPIRRVG
jgi:MATE family multidrug resistance protein